MFDCVPLVRVTIRLSWPMLMGLIQYLGRVRKVAEGGGMSGTQHEWNQQLSWAGCWGTA